MKPLIPILSLTLILAVTSVKAQDQYQAAMSQLVTYSDTAKSIDNLKLANSFGRIAETEKTKWLPFYYASLFTTLESLKQTNLGQIDPLCDQATQYLDQTDKLAPNNSEVYCLRSLIALARIKVNQTARGMAGLMEAQQALETANKLDPTNPRVYHMLGQQAFNTPEAFGGSKEKALQYFEKALSLLESQKDRESTIDVHWGTRTTVPMIAICRKYLNTVTKAN
ncbi:tetratricopeptide repeat protein [Spirosoma pollinicola]|uniref:Tetratricopeptide repeat protein n=1 Tax=Spirosoma pollinicola TaxID=2057025 RepID=A0A2K8Z3I0_9BACT|nr:hypothetical protein [Spirosoma pollinicola]AUD04425.1 hypothetical protein CWM47_22815 [Spirosoma pollinicola]